MTDNSATNNNTVKKRDFRCKAHAPSFKTTNINIPTSPDAVEWSKHFKNGNPPTLIDIGCGYGRFIFKAGEAHPDTNILGLELRGKVSEYVKLKIKERKYENVGVINTNALLFLPNFFKKGSLDKIFVLYPDPHFKNKKQKGRVICKQTMAIYEYLLKKGGELYISTDVKTLYDDMKNTIVESNYFSEYIQTYETLNENTTCDDQNIFELAYKGTDEASRAGVKTGEVYASIFTKL